MTTGSLHTFLESTELADSLHRIVFSICPKWRCLHDQEGLSHGLQVWQMISEMLIYMLV